MVFAFILAVFTAQYELCLTALYRKTFSCLLFTYFFWFCPAGFSRQPWIQGWPYNGLEFKFCINTQKSPWFVF